MPSVSMWAYGLEQTLELDQSTTALHQRCYVGNSRTQYDKFQIVLHCTAANNPTSRVISGWNAEAQRKVDWIAAGSPKNNPAWPEDRRGRFASAHFVVDREEHHPDSARPYAHVTQVVNELRSATRHSGLTRNSIGIEIANKGHYTGISYNEENDLPPEVRSDLHAYFRLRPPRRGNCVTLCYQAYQDKQYKALILLLRYLCATLGIRRVFSGHNADSNLERNWPISPRMRNFHGLFSHCNIHNNKTCGGPALHRNRLYRGITEEWWIPVNIDESERFYYTGPFNANWNLFHADGLSSGSEDDGTPIFSRPMANADTEALQETKSYFNLAGGVDSYFLHSEGNHGGNFPIGRNGCWHGGIHFVASESNPKVYAAASGTIVAARMGTIAELEEHTSNEFGSPRFILIRHAVFLQTHNVEVGGEEETRINYTAQPHIVFSLYMHLAPLPVDGEGTTIDYDHCEFVNHPEIPEWYKIWRNTNTGDISSGQVFNPEIEVMTGDHLGSCGRWYRQPHCLHFEIISGEEIALPLEYAFTGSENQTLVTEDNCFYAPDFQSAEGAACHRTNQSGQYDQLRNHACHHRSEWALYENDLSTIRSQLGEAVFQPIYENIERIVWYHRARRVWANVRSTNPLAEELLHNLPGDGRIWHYHPITFMSCVNYQLDELQSGFAGGHNTGQATAGLDLELAAAREVGAVRDGDATLETGFPFKFSV